MVGIASDTIIALGQGLRQLPVDSVAAKRELHTPQEMLYGILRLEVLEDLSTFHYL